MLVSTVRASSDIEVAFIPEVKECKNYDEIKFEIEMLCYRFKGNNKYCIHVSIDKDEFRKVPDYEWMSSIYYFDNKKEWHRYYDTFGCIILEILESEDGKDVVIDPFLGNEIFEDGDIVFFECDNSFHFIKRDENEELCLSNSNWNKRWFGKMPPLRYIHKVSEYYLEQLSKVLLAQRQIELTSENKDNYICKKVSEDEIKAITVRAYYDFEVDLEDCVYVISDTKEFATEATKMEIKTLEPDDFCYEIIDIKR